MLLAGIVFVWMAVGLAPTSRAEEPATLAHPLDVQACPEVTYIVYGTIPRLFYADQPDSLLDLIAYWDYRCGPAEAIDRIRILGAIWDGAFTEQMYGAEIIDELIWYNDPKRQKDPGKKFHPDIASGGVASEVDFVTGRDTYDAFTADLADQLLPHTPEGSPERFFCLFYSGSTEAAFAMLESDALEHTDLDYYYRRELQLLDEQALTPTVALTGGYWRPEGALARVGNKGTIGFLASVRGENWLLRIACDLRPGRATYPYLVNNGEIEEQWSDRFASLYAGLELGRTVLRIGNFDLDLFGGFGYDGVKPFLEEDLWLATYNANLGAGARVFFGHYQSWYLGVDGRREWLGDRNKGGTNLSGEAWSVRLAVGFAFNVERNRRLKGLQQ